MIDTELERPAVRVPAEWSHLFRLIPHYDPIATAEDGDWFDPKAAFAAITFIETYCTHAEGKLGGKPLILEPWQRAVVGCIFGWKRANGTRRYRTVFLYIPRKNGKSPLASAIALYMLLCDGEAGAAVFLCASSAKQAGRCFKIAQQMVKNRPQLSAITSVYRGDNQKCILYPRGMDSVLQVISARAEVQHGHIPSCVIIDELHTQPDRELVDVMASAMSSENRAQPLTIYITTADYDRPSICNETYDYAKSICDGQHSDHEFLPVVWEAGATDDPHSQQTWERANPNLGVSVSIDYMESLSKKARKDAAQLNLLKRAHLNIKTGQSVSWVGMEAWDACRGDITLLDWSLPCWGALDLSATSDMTAFTVVCPQHDGRVGFRCWFWLPEDSIGRTGKTQSLYGPWATDGYLQTTKGAIIDYKAVRAKIVEVGTTLSIEEIAVDRKFQGAECAIALRDEHGFEVVEFGQGFMSMAEPTVEAERLILSQRIVHDGDPIMRWMMGNCQVKIDEAGNKKLDKKRSTGKIDGAVCLVMGVGRATIGETEEEAGADDISF